MALRIRKKLFHQIFCGHPVEDTDISHAFELRKK